MVGIDNLKNTYPALLSHMEAEGYSEIYVANVRREVQRIVRLWDERAWGSYQDVYAAYQASSRSASYLREKRSMLRLVEQFDLRGRLPDGNQHSALFARGAYHRLLPVFRDVVDCYRVEARAQGKKESTVKVESSNGSSFFLVLQTRGFASLESITERAVLSFFASQGGRPAKSGSYKKHVAAVLKGAARAYPALAAVAGFLPELRDVRRNIQYLSVDEVRKVKEALRGDVLSLRDRAVGTLALHTGLRGCDIAALRTDSIDWADDVIRLGQEKTATELELPLSAAVGNAVWAYLASERPPTHCPLPVRLEQAALGAAESREHGQHSGAGDGRRRDQDPSRRPSWPAYLPAPPGDRAARERRAQTGRQPDPRPFVPGVPRRLPQRGHTPPAGMRAQH